ncbi:hypothetical protein FYZ17_08430, partial [Campylobacter jejuni]|nr:hypothetical protein [Campylobacter jejuni]ECQ7384970.1 hypothetical protein [Campylobacter jejuni]
KVDFASLFKYLASKNGKLEGQLYMYENNISKESAMGNWALDVEIKQALANGWKASSESINSYVGSIMDRLNNLIGQTRV